MHFSAICLDDQVSDLAIKRVTLHKQFPERTPTITVFQQRSQTTLLRAGHLLIDRCVKIDNQATPSQVTASFGANYRPTTGGKHDVVHLCKIIDGRRFALAKSFLTFFLKDESDVNTCPRLDLIITIGEG